MENGNRNRIHTGVIIFVTAVLLWMACGRTGTAEAAYTTDGTYYPDILEMETSFGDIRTLALDTCEYFFVLKVSDTEYKLGFIDGDVIDGIGELFERSTDHNYGFRCSHLFSVVYDTGRGSWVCGSVIGTETGKESFVSIGSKNSGFSLVGTSFPILERCLQTIRDVAGVELPQENLSFPGSGGGDVLTVPLLDTYVDIPVGDYKYYLILYDACKYDSDAVRNYTRVFLSDEPLQGYVENGAVILRADKKIVAYGMSSKTSASDYLASPGVYHSSSTALSTNGYSDYASNYDLSYNNKVYLPEKPYSPPPEETQPSVYDLYVRGLAYFKSVKGLDLSEYPYHYMYENPGSGQVNLFIFKSAQEVVDNSSFAGYPYSLSRSETPRLRLYHDGSIVYLEQTGAFTADAGLWSNTDLYYGGTLMSKAADFVQPSAARLYARLPEELQAYTYKIILRQDYVDAMTNDIVFYGWNDTNAELIIRHGDSAIAAARKGTVAEDSRTARYDLSAGQWAVEGLPGTYPGRTKNSVYCVPTVFYCNSDLFLQQSGQTGWYTVLQTVRRADTEPPVTWDLEDPFGPGSEIEKPEFSTGIDWLDKLLDGIGEFLAPFFNGLGKLFSRLFVPSSDYFKNKVDALRQKFCFWESVVSTVEVFLNFFEDTDFSKPPKITVNLSSTTSKYDYGTSATFLDLGWYEPYKPSVDVLLSSIMWVVFVWNTFKNLPSIISGVATAANVSAQVSAGGTLKIENSELKRSRARSGRWSR